MKQLVMIMIILQFALSQQTQEGIPYSQIHGMINNDHTITLPELNHDVLLEEDMFRGMGTPYRYGYKHEVQYSPENAGIFIETNDGGMIWQIRFISRHAYAISFEYNNLQSPVGGKIYIYTP